MESLSLVASDPAVSLALGAGLGRELEAGDILALWGELGVGKTLFAGGVARGLGVPEGIPITSPSFTIINEYMGRLRLYHLDLYRLAGFEDLDSFPWREALFGGGVAVIEWPERMGVMLPGVRLDVKFEWLGENSRTITFEAHGERQAALLTRWAASL